MWHYLDLVVHVQVPRAPLESVPCLAFELFAVQVKPRVELTGVEHYILMKVG
jgi:hypothetical protein